MPDVALSDGAGPCPSAEQLEAFTFGRLPEPELRAVAAHADSCQACAGVLERLVGAGDSFVARLRLYVAGETLPAESSRTEMPPLSGLVLPERLGEYELREVLGKGGMGVVFKAWQERPGRFVAVKLALAAGPAGLAAFDRLRTEVEAIGRLQHPNVIQVFGYGELGGLPYFVMEFIDGQSLAGRLREGPLPPREAAGLVRALARGVHAAHQRGILHRDLKPANVLLGEDPPPGEDRVVKVTDFGLAKFLDPLEADGRDHQTRTGAVLGTAAYMAPEQARGETAAVGHAADVYGLGAILYEALTGKPPFRGPNQRAILSQVESVPPDPPSRSCRGLSPELEAVCLKCLAKSPAGRYPSAQALADDLDRWLRGEPTEARPPGWHRRARGFLRRHAVLLLAGLALGSGAVVLRLSDPDRPLRRLQEELRRGQPAVLVGETGKPAWSRLLAGEESSQTSTAEDGTFAVHTWGTCLLELLPDPPPASYRFSVEVRHDKSDGYGEVGLFCAHQGRPEAAPQVHLFLQLSFNDVRSAASAIDRMPAGLKRPPKVGNSSTLFPHLFSPRPEPGIDGRLGGRSGPRFQVVGEAGGRWRRLEVLATPEKVEGFWEGASIGELRFAEITPTVENDLAKVRARHPDDAPLQVLGPPAGGRGGLGLVLVRGSASFRRAAVTPLSVES